MRSIAFMNQKGGVGKTTTAVHVAAALSRLKKRVMLLDLDPQAHSTLHVGVEVGPADLTLYDVLVRGAPMAEALRFVRDELELIPAHTDLVAAEIELAGRKDRERVLSHALHPHVERLDFLIIDCPPSLGLLTLNALAAVSEVIIPLQPHFLGLQGLSKLLETVTLVRDGLNPALRVSGVVFCMFENATKLAQEVRADVHRFIESASGDDAWHAASVFKTCIRRNIKLAECPSFGQTIFDYAPSSHGAEDYIALAREVLAMNPPAVTRDAADIAYAATDASAAAQAAGLSPQPQRNAAP